MVNIANFENKPIVRRPTLPFNFKEGACGTFSEPSGNEFALLCFDREDPTTCHECTDLNNATESCKPLPSKPTNKSTRNAIRLGNYKGRIKMTVHFVILTSKTFRQTTI